MRLSYANHIRAQRSSGAMRLPAFMAGIVGIGGLSLVYAPQAAAATLDVCASGCSFKTIQSAVNQAKAGDTVWIGPGTYFENVKIPGFALTLQGAGRRRVVIDGNLQGPVFTIGNQQPPLAGDTITFSDLTVARGLSAAGGGILVLNLSPLVLQHSILLNNRSEADGGAVLAINTQQITISDCNFINNQAVNTGGALATHPESIAVQISDSVFSHNSAGNFGGAIGTDFLHASNFNITRTTFTQNSATYGGAIQIGNLYGGAVNLTDVILSGNSASKEAGALTFAGTATLTRTIVTQNLAGTNGGGIVDADRFKGPSQLSLVDSEVVHNTAGTQAGGIFLSGQLTQTDSTIAHNSPNDCIQQGGGGPCN